MSVIHFDLNAYVRGRVSAQRAKQCNRKCDIVASNSASQSDTSQSEASVRSCMRKTVDSAFLQKGCAEVGWLGESTD